MEEKVSFLIIRKTAFVFSLLLLGLIFYTSGMAKLFYPLPFPGIIGPPWLEEKLSGYGLGFYARFIGWAQVLCGFLLITKILRAVGYLISFSMLVNILIITISLKWRGTPWVVAVLIFMNIYLFVIDRRYFLPLLGITNNKFKSGIQFRQKKLIALAFAFILSATAILLPDEYLIHKWIVSAISIIAGGIIGWRK